MAGNAGKIDAEERLAVENGQLVVGIELLHHAEIVAIVGLRLALHVLARDHVGGGDDVVALGRGGDDGAGDVVVGAVDAPGSPSSSSGTGSARAPSCRWRGTDP